MPRAQRCPSRLSASARRGGSLTLLLLALAACQPDAAGRCSSAAECDGGALCAIEGICILASPTCSLVCTAGQLCSAGACVTLKPHLDIALGTTVWLTQGATVTVHVDAAPELTLGALTLTVSAGGATVAQGTLQKAQAGDNLVSISGPSSPVQGQATLVADLSYPGPDGAQQDALSSPVTVGIDMVAPTVTLLSLPPPADAVAGWVPRTGPDLVVKAQVVDSGSGPASAKLELTNCPAHTSVPCEYTGVAESAASQGLVTYEFAVPRAVQAAGSEAKVAFRVVGTDVAGNTAEADSGALALQIDDAPPTVSLARVDYAGAQPLFASVCARNDQPACTDAACAARGFHCGRGADAAHADHALRDDTVTAVFDVLDCGAGVASAGATFLAESGGVATQAVAAVDDGAPVAGTCPAGAPQNHQLHHFALTLPLSALGALDASDATGTTRVRLAQTALDRLGRAGSSPRLTAASADGDGVVLVSLVRWRAQLGGAASGAPALLPAASAGAARTVVAGSTPASTATSAPNLFLLDPAGAETAIAVAGGIASDVAVGAGGALYMPGTPHPCSGGNGLFCAALQLATFSGATVTSCDDEKPGTQLGAPLALGPPQSGSPYEVVTGVATVRAGGSDDAFTWKPSATLGCSKLSSGKAAPDPAQTPAGVTAAGGTVFISSPAGFASMSSTSGNFGVATAQSFVDPGPVNLPAPPALALDPLGGGGLEPIFGAFSDAAHGSGELRSATACTAVNCWQSGPLTFSPLAVSHTPLYLSLGAGAAIFATTDTGQVVALSFGGAKLGDTSTPVTDPASASLPFVSPPLLLGAGQTAPEASPLVVLQGDGKLRLVQFPAQGASTAPVIDRTLVAGLGAWPAGTRPQTPVADARGTGSVIYVVDGGCPASRTGCGPSWLWAVQLDVAPRPASATAWTRPGHDSCNTRNASADAACR